MPHDSTTSREDLALYRRLIGTDLTRAVELCRERLLTVPEGQPAATWTKDLSLARFLAGDVSGAFDLLTTHYATAVKVSGAFRGRYELSIGQTYAGRGLTDRALDYFTSAYEYAKSDPCLCAQIDTNTGRCYTAAKNPSESYFYFDRAEQVARQFEDWHLLGEIAESRALAFEAEGRIEEAEASAWRSVQLLTQTGDKMATAESVTTWQRVRVKR